MASNITAQRQKATLSDSGGGVVAIPYRVVEKDRSLTLAILDARDAAITQGTADIGIPPIAAPAAELSQNEVQVDLSFSLPEYRELVAFKEQNPGGTYTPTIIEESAARIFPPQPVERREAFEVIQSIPGVAYQVDGVATGNETPDADEGTAAFNALRDQIAGTTLLNQRRQIDADGKAIVTTNRVPIYPPQENFSRLLSIPASLLTSQLYFDLSDLAHTLNSDDVTFGVTATDTGVTFSPGTLMLLSGSMEVSNTGAAVVRLGFAVGKAYDVTWTRSYLKTNGDEATVQRTLKGVGPFSRVEYHGVETPATTTSPASLEKWGVIEQRVWPERVYAPFFNPSA